jgi:uncharacterized protein (DUF302 family)
MSTNDTALLVAHKATATFGETLGRVTQAIESAGMTIFARIDHAANARSVGLQMPPATVLIYGNAKGGTPVMLGTPLAALDLPLRVLVRETEDGKASIAFHPVKAMLGQAGVPEDAAARLEPAQALLLAAVSQ